MNTVSVKNLEIGARTPAIIVPLTGSSIEDVVAQATAALAAKPDCLEWRADYLQPFTIDSLQACVDRLLPLCGDTPLLFTVRTADQGGEQTISSADYRHIVKRAIEGGWCSLVDIEFSAGESLVRELTSCAHDHGVITVVSDHHFTSTPSFEHLVTLLKTMASLGADIPKVATMAQNAQDTLRLMSATEAVRAEADVPIISMAMGPAGTISRVTGAFFGSAATFCTVGAASAPGQVPLDRAREIMALLDSIIES